MTQLKELLDQETHRIDADPDALESTLRRRDRKRRNHRIAAGVVAFAFFVAAIWTVTSEGWFDRTEVPAHPVNPPTQEDTQPPTDSGRRGFVGLAPVGTEPSLPETGELVISFGNFCCPGQALNVYRDGRIIWGQFNVASPGQKDWVHLIPQRANKWETGWLEQRLTSRGVELLRSELISSGLFEQSRSFKQRVEGASISVLNGSRRVTLRLSSDHDPIGATAEQTREIERLIAILKDPGAWLPADAWVDREIGPFIPSRYEVTMNFYSNGGTAPDDPSELPPPADELLRAADFVRSSSACQTVSIAEARRIQRELEDAFGGLTIPYGAAVGTPVGIDSLLPHQRGCDGYR